jgi:Ca2+-binding EF-hand superfamily protein
MDVHKEVAKILFDMCDLDQDGLLDLDEFCVAM